METLGFSHQSFKEEGVFYRFRLRRGDDLESYLRNDKAENRIRRGGENGVEHGEAAA